MKNLETILAQPVAITNELILKLISCIDLTSLNNMDTTESVQQLVALGNKGVQDTYPAAFCVFSNFGELVHKTKKAQIKTAVVSGAFPIGQNLSASKIAEVQAVCKTNIDEIDVVMNRGDLKDHHYDLIINEIAGMKKIMREKHLKVILETGELQTEPRIKKASELAIKGGADFIKTSTGKTSIGATPEAVFIMCNVIKAHYEKTGVQIGIKPSGGIRTLDQALAYYKIIDAVLGKEWLSPVLFRIGASSLYTDLVNRL